MSWYKGLTLLEAMQCLKHPSRADDKPLRMVVHRTHKIRGFGDVVVGRVEFGVINKGQSILIQPGAIRASVKSIEFHNENKEQATSGMIVGICLGTIEGDIQRGSVISDLKKKPAKTIRSFEGHMILIGGPKKFLPGYRATICAHGIYISATVTQLIHSFNKVTREVIKQKPEYVDSTKGE